MAKRFQIIGHRGAAGLAPENTLPSFKTALELGCDWLELDVHPVGPDARLAVIHDAKLDRTTDHKGPVAKLSVDDLKLIDAGNGAAIPTLEAVLALVAEHATSADRPGSAYTINVELKGAGSGRALARRPIASADGPRILVSSFNRAELAAFRMFDEETPVALLFDRWHRGWLGFAQEYGAVAVNLNYRIATRRRVERIREAGLEVYTYTVNRVVTAERLERIGVSGIFTDRPDLMLTRFSRVG